RANRHSGANDVCEFICNQAQLESKCNPRSHIWRKTLRYLWEIEPFIENNLDRLRGSEHDGPLVPAIIGLRYGPTPQTIQNSLRARTSTIPPDELSVLLLQCVHFEPRAARGRKPGRSKSTDARITVAADLRSQGRKLYSMKSDIFPEQSSAELAYR